MAMQYVPLEEELKKNPELKESDIEILRQWLAKQPYLPKMNDSEIALFLHSNYYLIEPTKVTIDTYYTCRTHIPEFFTKRDAIECEDVRDTMKKLFVLPLKGETAEGYKVVYARLIDFEPSHFNHYEALKFFNMIVDLWMFREGTMKGYILVFDTFGLSLAHIGQLRPMALKKYLYYLQEAMPVRLKGLHFTNSVPAMDVLLSMMKPFMKKELIQILFIHTDINSLAKYINIENLPNELGGKTGPMLELFEQECKNLENNREWFAHDEANARVDESLRPGKAKSAETLFGAEGSFKKLEID